jgi:thiamine kinase-like enzyme
LIDWEYAGLGERFFDLASLCVYHRYDRQQREQLLIAYAAQSDAQHWHRLELSCWLFDYVRELWTQVREGLSAS